MVRRLCKGVVGVHTRIVVGLTTITLAAHGVDAGQKAIILSLDDCLPSLIHWGDTFARKPYWSMASVSKPRFPTPYLHKPPMADGTTIVADTFGLCC